MSDTTQIEWASATFSPWIGCTKVSPGCAHCYAEALDRQRFSKTLGSNPHLHWGKGQPRHRTSAATWRNPAKWNREAGPPRPRIFPSLCDVFDREVPDEWRIDFFDLIRRTQNLDWLLLTKRPGDALRFLETLGWTGEGEGCWTTRATRDFQALRLLRNIWMGVSVEDQQRADERIQELLRIPARVRFLSVEPLLGPVDLQLVGSQREATRLDWVIVGGESGPGARPCNVAWIRSIVRQCKAAGVPCFVKQLGANVVDRNDAGFEGGQGEWPMDTHTKELDPMVYQGAPVRVLMNHRKGGDPAEWPEDLRVREFPKTTA